MKIGVRNAIILISAITIFLMSAIYVEAIQRCESKFLEEKRCYGNNLQQKYQNIYCTISWKTIETCKWGCNFQTLNCNPPPCQQGYTSNYRCNSKSLQEQYQTESCKQSWKTIQECKWGCDSTTFSCKPTPCTIGFSDNYKCSGTYLKQEYFNSNCLVSWKTVKRCAYKCVDNQCVVEPIATITTTIGQMPPKCETLIQNGNPSDKLDVVFVGYGYDDTATFASDVEQHKNAILSFEPFASNQNKFNFYRIDTFVDLGCHFGEEEKRIFGCDVQKVESLASACPFDQIIVIVNTNRYGGGTDLDYPIAVTYKYGYVDSVVVHEFAHSFGKLPDHYGKSFLGCDVRECILCSLTNKFFCDSCSQTLTQKLNMYS